MSQTDTNQDAAAFERMMNINAGQVSAPFELVDNEPGALNMNGMMRYRA